MLWIDGVECEKEIFLNTKIVMDFKELKEQIKCLYYDFFNSMNIDMNTGIIKGTNLRFIGFPYIGANYIDAPVKILFIALDTGKDECFEDNSYHSFENRENIFPTGMLDFNAHIAGMYATALYILKEKMGFESAWSNLWNNRKFKCAKAIRESYDSLPKDLLSYVAYENRFRFVTIGRGHEKNERSGGKDRIWINPQRESQLLIDEINVFSPDIIIFQGKEGLWNCNINKLKMKYKVVEAYHPSCWQKGADKLQYIVDKIGVQL